MASPKNPAIIVIFGITGDLAQRKLLPALYHLFKDDLLSEQTVILGITRRDVTTAEMVEKVEGSVRAADGSCEPEPLTRIQGALRMHTMSQTEPLEYVALKKLLDTIESEKGVCMDRLYYLSIPPQMFGPIVRNLGAQGLNKSCEHGTAGTRLLIEKPFGYNLASARDLIAETAAYFTEDQIFRIDHYVAKDAVQNIIEFRRLFPGIERIWNSQNISTIEITVFEKLGIEGRAIFYEQLGALRDFVQSHMLQMLAIVAMDLPSSGSSDEVHLAHLRLLQSIIPSAVADAERGQYEGYTKEVNNADSYTETFARLRLHSKDERWQGTDMILQTGKAMQEKKAEIQVIFSSPTGEQSLIFHIQPEEGIQLIGDSPQLQELMPRVISFNESHPAATNNILGYERVFIDAINDDHTLFTTHEEVLAAWKIVDNVIEAWAKDGHGLQHYPEDSAEIV